MAEMAKDRGREKYKNLNILGTKKEIKSIFYNFLRLSFVGEKKKNSGHKIQVIILIRSLQGKSPPSQVRWP